MLQGCFGVTEVIFITESRYEVAKGSDQATVVDALKMPGIFEIGFIFTHMIQ